jgi:Mg2+ and Co2+ transporter CorA
MCIQSGLANSQEIDVLTDPQMRHTRELHIVSGELNILKRSLYPLYNMINALREPRGNRPKTGNFGGPGCGDTGYDTPECPLYPSGHPDEKGHGAEISASARVYLADVADHVLILTEEVDILRGTVENMINMVRNPSYIHAQLV